jgi:translation initiation factor 3 subunit C
MKSQGVQPQRFGERSVEQETIERSRMLPYYMHINLELLECIYLVASMLLEVPSMAANAYEAKKVIISRPFRRLLEFSLKQPFNGPPENVRDHIMGASKKLSRGDWKAATALIHAITIWDLLPDPVKLKEMLAL